MTKTSQPQLKKFVCKFISSGQNIESGIFLKKLRALKGGFTWWPICFLSRDVVKVGDGGQKVLNSMWSRAREAPVVHVVSEMKVLTPSHIVFGPYSFLSEGHAGRRN